MTRTSILLWSAASGFVVGILAGLALLAVVTLVVNIVPGIPERLVGRLRMPVVLILLVGVPLAATLLGYMEGRAKM